MPIRLHFKIDTSFQEKEINFIENDTFYMFSDGFADQFGGHEGKRYLNNNFKLLLCKLTKFPFNQRQIKIEEKFNNWKGNLEQVDDVLVIGFKFQLKN